MLRLFISLPPYYYRIRLQKFTASSIQGNIMDEIRYPRKYTITTKNTLKSHMRQSRSIESPVSQKSQYLARRTVSEKKIRTIVRELW